MRSIAPRSIPYDDQSISKSDKDKPKEKKNTKPKVFVSLLLWDYFWEYGCIYLIIKIWRL